MTVRSSPRRSAARADSSSGVMTDSPWDEAYEIEIDREATSRSTEPSRSSRRSATASSRWRRRRSRVRGGIPHDLAGGRRDDPRRRRRRGAARAAHPLAARARSRGARPRTGRGARVADRLRERVIRRFSSFDAVLTPALALTPRPVGWYDPDDGERNFAQQVQYTPFTSFVNVAGLPAITVPVTETADGRADGGAADRASRRRGGAVRARRATRATCAARRSPTARVVSADPIAFHVHEVRMQDLGNAYLTSRSGAAPAPGLPQLPRERATRRATVAALHAGDVRRRRAHGVRYGRSRPAGEGRAAGPRPRVRRLPRR